MKRFLLRTATALIPVFVFFLLSAYFTLRLKPEMTGDLGQLGKICFGRTYEEYISRPELDGKYTLTYTSDQKNTPLSTSRIITIGDSFSQQEERGYQNFLGHALGQTIINLPRSNTPEQQAIDLLHSGFFDTLSVRVLIIESIERSMSNRLLNLDTKKENTTAQVHKYLMGENEKEYTPQGGVFDQRNIHQTKDWILLHTGLSRSPVCTAKLRRKLFSCRGEQLYFYIKDLELTEVSATELNRMCESITRLHQLFSDRGIRLIYLVATDKYDFYQEDIVDNCYPEKRLLTQLTAGDSLSGFVDTRRLLRPALKRGEQDLYMAHDTHWSQKAARIIAEELKSLIGD